MHYVQLVLQFWALVRQKSKWRKGRAIMAKVKAEDKSWIQNLTQINTTKFSSVHIQISSGLVLFEFFGSVNIYEFGFISTVPVQSVLGGLDYKRNQ